MPIFSNLEISHLGPAFENIAARFLPVCSIFLLTAAKSDTAFFDDFDNSPKSEYPIPAKDFLSVLSSSTNLFNESHAELASAVILICNWSSSLVI